MAKQITIPGVIYAAIPEDWNYGAADVIDGVYYRFTVHEHPGKTPVARISLVFDAPEQNDITAGFVADLENEKKKLMADHQNEITKINSKIQQLLAITCEAV